MVCSMALQSRSVEADQVFQPHSRVLVFVVTYNAQTTIRDVLSRIPAALSDDFDVEVLVIDDAS